MGVYIPDSTNIDEWISSKFAVLAEIIHDYDSYLELRWIPPGKRTRDDKKPYVIVDTRSNTPVMYASELDVPEQLLAHLFYIDNKTGTVLSKLEAHEAALEAFKMKEYMNKIEEAADEARFFMKSPLNTIRFNGKKFDDQRRHIGPAVDRKQL